MEKNAVYRQRVSLTPWKHLLSVLRFFRGQFFHEVASINIKVNCEGHCWTRFKAVVKKNAEKEVRGQPGRMMLSFGFRLGLLPRPTRVKLHNAKISLRTCARVNNLQPSKSTHIASIPQVLQLAKQHSWTPTNCATGSDYFP